MRKIFFTVLFSMIFMVLSSTAQSADNLNGNFWVELSYESKLSFLAGFVMAKADIVQQLKNADNQLPSDSKSIMATSLFDESSLYMSTAKEFPKMIPLIDEIYNYPDLKDLLLNKAIEISLWRLLRFDMYVGCNVEYLLRSSDDSNEALEYSIGACMKYDHPKYITKKSSVDLNEQ